MATSKPNVPDLSPTHLMDSSEDLQESVEAVVASAGKAPDDKSAMKQQRYTFPFEYKDANGKVYSGTFTNVVPTRRVLATIGAYQAKLGGGAAFDTLDPQTRVDNMITAHLTYTLEKEGRPAWAQDFLELTNTAPLYKLWEVVAEHEATFLGDK